jgi:hypothetical protein
VRMMAAASYIRAAHTDTEGKERKAQRTADQNAHGSGRRPVG